MRFLKLTLAYDGTQYGGWQQQPNRVTIQSVLENALRRVTGERVRTAASGRTDAGVHASGQVVSCSLEAEWEHEDLRRALNACLPQDVCLLSIDDAPDGFHAIRDAVRKRYRYQMQTGPLRDVFRRNFVWHVWHRLDVEAMRAAAQPLLGRHDFASFQTSGSGRKTTHRTLSELTISCHPLLDGQFISVDIEADGFLYNMVRNIVGTLVDVGRGKHPPGWVGEVLAACDRRSAGMTAPPQGLCLVSVQYDVAPTSPPDPLVPGPPPSNKV
jgi:tRNA pseudouridine38-40 synthase